MKPRHLVPFIVVVAAACTGPGDSAPSTTIPATSPTSSAASTPVTAPPASIVFEEVVVEVAEGSAGVHLVDEDGRSLYLFTLDDERTSTCVEACAEMWPPLLGDPVAGEGVDPTLLGNVERGNGAIQVTYAGHPLYRYAGDDEPGEAEGQGLNEVWFLVGPDGEAITG